VEQLNTYIQQARQQGQNDAQIHQSLVAAGWAPEQISSALSHASPQVSPAGNVGQNNIVSAQQPIAAKRSIQKLKLLIPVIVMLIVLISSGAYALFGHQTSYQTVIQDFIVAVQKKDKANADNLESPALQAYGKKNVGSSSFYDTCQQAGQLCTPLFSSSFLSKATKTYKNYTASNGTKGKEIIYTEKQSLSGAQAGGAGCSSNSTSTLAIAAVPKGSSWLIDHIDPNISFSANLCLQNTQSSATSPSSVSSTSQPSVISQSTSTTSTTKETTQPSASSTTSTPQEPLTGTVTISSDGCSVTGFGEVGLRFNIIVTKAGGGGGGEANYLLPNSGELTEYSGGYQNETVAGEILNPDGTINSSATSTITAASCPPGDPSQ
jgi:hypothetical protein